MKKLLVSLHMGVRLWHMIQLTYLNLSLCIIRLRLLSEYVGVLFLYYSHRA